MNILAVGNSYYNYPAFKGCSSTIQKKTLNRALLKSTSNNDLKPLFGPKEVKKAKVWVAGYTAGNSVTAALTAQAPGFDELALTGIEVLMATHIFNGIYDFKLSKTLLKSVAAGVAGHAVGKTTFKMLSKGITWIPVLGNTVNAVVAGGTTAALGAALIDIAEEMDKARKRGEKLDEFIKAMENEDNKKGR